MTAVERQPVTPETKVMPYAVRPLEERDLPQAARIERDAFPSLFPPTSFHREIKNPMASYLVAWRREGAPEDAPEDDMESPTPASASLSPSQGDGHRPGIGRLVRNALSLWPRRDPGLEAGQQFIAGFLGTLYMVGEAHIVSVGVWRDYRGKGIGELLLIAAIEQAMERRARVVTLEVRVSNHVARNLYAKYGFVERGLRKAYYSDNREDALIMTTEPIHLPPYANDLRRLVDAHERRWGRAERVLT